MIPPENEIPPNHESDIDDNSFLTTPPPFFLIFFCYYSLFLSLDLRKPEMELFYIIVFGGLAAIVAALELSKSSKDRINTPSAFNAFKNNYLLVYSLMMGTRLRF